MAKPKLRIVNYNIAKMKGDEDAMKETIAKSREGDAEVGAYVFQEVTIDNLSTLQELVGSGYSMGTYTGKGELSGGAQAIFYRSDMFRETRDTHTDFDTGAGRRASRWTLRSKKDGGDLYIYGAHLKAFPGEDNEKKRAAGVEAIRQDISSLPPNARTLVTGDMNFYSDDEPGHKGFIDMGLQRSGRPEQAKPEPEDPLFDPKLLNIRNIVP